MHQLVLQCSRLFYMKCDHCDTNCFIIFTDVQEYISLSRLCKVIFVTYQKSLLLRFVVCHHDHQSIILCDQPWPITGSWRKLHNYDHHNLYSSPYVVHSDQINKNGKVGPCSMHNGYEKCIQNFSAETSKKEIT